MCSSAALPPETECHRKVDGTAGQTAVFFLAAKGGNYRGTCPRPFSVLHQKNACGCKDGDLADMLCRPEYVAGLTADLRTRYGGAS